jgi:S1-C subfamily serine protease
VGSWRVSAFTRGQTAVFDNCTLRRVQGDGFTLMVGYMAQGIVDVAMESPDWGLTPRESYTTSVVVAGDKHFTFNGRAMSARVMSLRIAPEFLDELKTGVSLQVSANQKQYAIRLDGIEAATARAKDCLRQYGAPGGDQNSSQAMVAPPAPPPPATTGSPLVSSIQNLLARLGYDPGPVNGVVGLKTNIAIAAFQKGQGETGDGQPSETVRARLLKVAAERGAIAPTPNAPPREKTAVSSGTGFYIGADTIITNFHVINGCTDIRIRKNGAEHGAARVVVVSQSDDLAALRPDVRSTDYLKLRAGVPIKAAEQVMVFGYPLSGALSSSGNTTLGNVTALTGMRDDGRYIQISASVQPGNSGGPALDDAGRLIGVVVSKLNALAIARVTGDIPQNVNFAIKVSTLASFLEAHNIRYETDVAAGRELTNVQRAEKAEAASTQLECRK